jgi:hypothetical protein
LYICRDEQLATERQLGALIARDLIADIRAMGLSAERYGKTNESETVAIAHDG